MEHRLRRYVAFELTIVSILFIFIISSFVKHGREAHWSEVRVVKSLAIDRQVIWLSGTASDECDELGAMQSGDGSNARRRYRSDRWWRT